MPTWFNVAKHKHNLPVPGFLDYMELYRGAGRAAWKTWVIGSKSVNPKTLIIMNRACAEESPIFSELARQNTADVYISLGLDPALFGR
jgi:hypothetical protein